MNVVLIETEGRGHNAVIEVDGQRLTVRDALSPADRAASPGPVVGARFDAVLADPRSPGRAPQDNPECHVGLEHQRGWRYLGHGRLLSVDPVRIDLGLLVLEPQAFPPGNRETGEYLTVSIDRISLTAVRR
ncbi:MAG: hypothetical protein ACE5FL_01100 [Myxococcota bacterium]